MSFLIGMGTGMLVPIVLGLWLGIRADAIAEARRGEPLRLRVARRIGEMKGAGWPWQRSDIGLLQDCLEALPAEPERVAS